MREIEQSTPVELESLRVIVAGTVRGEHEGIHRGVQEGHVAGLEPSVNYVDRWDILLRRTRETHVRGRPGRGRGRRGGGSELLV